MYIVYIPYWVLTAQVISESLGNVAKLIGMTVCHAFLFCRDTISHAFEGTQRGAILTTHYMDEADALCSKVAIMVSGKLK